jgi:hypothetical protein
MKRLLDAPLVRDVFPELVRPLEVALTEEERPELASTIGSLRVHGLCGCGDSSCLSVYTTPPPRHDDWAERLVPLQRETVGLGGYEPPTPFCVDVIDGAIAYVEIIWGDRSGASELKERHADLLAQTVAEPETQAGAG